MIRRQLWASRLSVTGLAQIDGAGIASLTQFPESTWATRVSTASIFRHDQWLYGYLEAWDSDLAEPFATAFLAEYCTPIATSLGQCWALTLPDIFHDGSPADDAQWRSSADIPQQRIGSLARLKPETYSRYVFYHYQRQAELPQSFNRRYIIGAHDTTIFSYQELPAVTTTPPLPLLATHNTPRDWQAVMEPHFVPWTTTPGDQQYWQVLPCLWSYTRS
jgi:hypothetical protein